MKNDRLRVPIDEPYIMAIGRATFVFATLEWNAVWCCERMQRNYIRSIRRKTAGKIAIDLVRLAMLIDQGRDGCLGPAIEFLRLVELRNGILHGKPSTAPTGEQRLFHNGALWTPEAIDEVADQFAACSARLNHLLYTQLN
jgi:hypothetical protein